ncbi:hypothetical protein [Pseudoalteromonas sp. S558]|uniref:hypothetical protein n=1 Tax=Pseudoalteromonas sp. S558 TaxID=2066515 RepID=UPI00110B6D17|nr:hypothetical protein [Pseudoalteromonas sp. S558]TMO05264.1 hypothetical protein CWB66_07095 [Pseudoalteromonas sp. S558]
MDSINFNWYKFSEELLSTKKEEGCKPFLLALDNIKQGNVNGAITALQDLNELQYLLSVIILEIQHIKLGGDRSLLTLFTVALRENVAIGSVDTSHIYHKIKLTWARDVCALLPDDDVIYRNQYQNYDGLLIDVINERCRLGLHIEALPLVHKVNSYYRETLSETWANVVSGLPEGDVKEQALMELARVGAYRPMIQDGGEEASAFANAIKGFTEIDLESSHPAVQVSFKGLLRLSRHRAEKDVRSFGTFTAQVAAARAASRLRHDGWLDIAKKLADNIYDKDLEQRAMVALQVAEFHCLEKPISELQPIIESIGLVWSGVDDPLKAINNYIDSKPLKKVSADDELANAIMAGKDMSAEVALRMVQEDKENKYYTRAYNRFLLGCELCLPDEQLNRFYEELDWHHEEALVIGASRLSRRQPERVLPYLKRGYPQGDQYGTYTESLLPFLTPDLLAKAERFFIDVEESEPLTLFIAHWVLHDNLHNAARILGYLGETTATREWVPCYRRGDRAENPFITIAQKEAKAKPLPYLGEVSDIKAAIKACTTTALLLQLTTNHWQDKQLIEAVLKAAKLKKYQKTLDDRCALIKLYLVANELETAVELLPSVNTGRRRWTNAEYGADPIQDILSFLMKSPENLTLELFNILLKEVSKIFPQWIWSAYFSLARLSCHLSKPERVEAQQAIIKTASKVFKFPSDNTAVYFGFLKGTLEVEGYSSSQSNQLETWFYTIKDLMDLKGCYVGIVWIIEQVANLKTHLPKEVWEKFSVDLYTNIQFSEYKYKARSILEQTLLHLWSVNDLTLLKALIESNKLPEHLQYDFYRSIWKDIHLAPNPYDVLALTKPDLKATSILKNEFTESLCRVMVEHQHPDAKRMQNLLQSI